MLFTRREHLHVEDVLSLREVSISTSKGQAIKLKGKNGAGKSSLLKSFCGFMPFSGGSIIVNKKNISPYGPLLGVDEDLTIEQILEERFFLFGGKSLNSNKSPEDIVALFDLGKKHKKPYRVLSSGQKCKIGLINLCVGHRGVWVLDEGLIYLDKKGRRTLQSLISSHRRKGGSCFIVSHEKVSLSDANVVYL